MTEIELTTFNNIVNQTIADIDNTFTLVYSDNTDCDEYLDLEWMFEKIIDNNHNIFIDITINEDYEISPSYFIKIDCVIYPIKPQYPAYTEYNDYSADNIDIDTLVNNIKQTYNNVISKYNANKGVE